ncbi:MAG: hypothetical protein IKZ28_06980, partial [Clostridia bacterium]|nr:hypothetical protein [Clostridia bacterium]
MILTVCMSPCTDVTIELDTLRVGKTNVVKSKNVTYAGKALNVALGVARLGGEACVTGVMYNENGYMFENMLGKEGVGFTFAWNEGRARENYKFIDKRSMLTEINDRGETVSREKQEELIRKVKKLSESCEIAVMSGSLPKGVKPEFYAEVLEVIPKNVKVIVDTEKANMLSAISSREIFMAKPNLRELENFAGETVVDVKDMLRAAQKYIDLGVQNVLVSLGADG